MGSVQPIGTVRLWNRVQEASMDEIQVGTSSLCSKTTCGHWPGWCTTACENSPVPFLDVEWCFCLLSSAPLVTTVDDAVDCATARYCDHPRLLHFPAEPDVWRRHVHHGPHLGGGSSVHRPGTGRVRLQRPGYVQPTSSHVPTDSPSFAGSRPQCAVSWIPCTEGQHLCPGCLGVDRPALSLALLVYLLVVGTGESMQAKLDKLTNIGRVTVTRYGPLPNKGFDW